MLTESLEAYRARQEAEAVAAAREALGRIEESLTLRHYRNALHWNLGLQKHLLVALELVVRECGAVIPEDER